MNYCVSMDVIVLILMIVLLHVLMCMKVNND